MSKQETLPALPKGQGELAKQLDQNVLAVLGSTDLQGFEKAYMVANATSELKRLLTPEYMKPILALQGNKLGFKTDKDDAGGYSEEIVKNCLIEAVLMGLQPIGNQFNIIAGNCYPTKEGFGHLLSRIPTLSYKLNPELPRIDPGNTKAAVKVHISWTYKGGSYEETIDLPIKMNQRMGTDAVLGKATRKARAWLFNTINGTDITDADVLDVDSQVVQSTPAKKDVEEERIAELIRSVSTLDELKALDKNVPDSLRDLYNWRVDNLTTK